LYDQLNFVEETVPRPCSIEQNLGQRAPNEASKTFWRGKGSSDLQDEQSQRIVSILKEIRSLHSKFELASKSYEKIIEGYESKDTLDALRVDGEYWRAHAYRNALIKLRLLVENNFLHVETLSLLSTTRYIFEVVVWLRLLKNDSEYGLVFYWRLMTDQLQHHKKTKENLEHEVRFFKNLDDEESRLNKDTLDKLLKVNKKPSGDDVAKAFSFVSEEIDRRARRNFSTYGNEAKKNGYGFQSHLIETKVISGFIERIEKIEADRDSFKKSCPDSARKKCFAKWNWKDHARSVGMDQAYDFIYSYTSRLLHAAPFSILTDQKNLEPSEMVLFLDYMYVSMLDVLDLSEVPEAKRMSIN
jgi:hypothetical protein